MLGFLNLFLLATPIASLILFPFHLIEKLLWVFAHGRNVMAQALWFCLYVFFWTVGFALMMLVTAAFVSKYGTDLSLNSYVAPWLANVFNVLYQWVSFPYHRVCAIFQLGTTSWHFVYSDQVRPLDLKWAKTEDLIVIRDLGVALLGWVWVVSSNFNHRALDRSIRRQEAQADLELAQQAAEDAAAAAQAAEAVLAAGPVTSVNGRQGVVVLGMSDIAGLVSALASKAESSHGHTIAQVSNLQAALDAITDGGIY